MQTLDNINWSLLRDKISDIKESVEILSDYASRDTEDLLKNQETLRSAKYTFVVLAEATINIATHICVETLDEAPASYADSFHILAENDFIDLRTSEKMAQLAGFRNLLVHRYADIDEEQMIEMMKEDLSWVNDFVAGLGNMCQGDEHL